MGEKSVNVNKISDFHKEVKKLKTVIERHKEESDLFHKFFENAPIGKCITRADGNFQKVNPEFCKILGYTEEEILKKSFIDITHPDDREKSRKYVKAILGGAKKEAPFEKRYIKKDGSTIWAHVTPRLVKDSGGNPLYFLTYLIDINESRNLQKSLKESESRFRSLIEKAPVPLAYLKLSGELILYNEMFEKTFGYNRSDIPSLDHWLELAYPDEIYRKWMQSQWEERIKVLADMDEPLKPLEQNITCKNGEVKVMEVAGVIVGDSYLGTFTDITERRAMETHVTEIVTELRLIHEHVPIAILLLDENYRIYRVNGSATDLLNLPPKDIIGMQVGEVLSCECYEGCGECHICTDCGVIETIKETFSSKKGVSEKEISIITRPDNDSKVSLDLQISTSFIDFNDRPRVLMCLQDITARKRDEREKKLLEEKFRQAQKMEAVGRLAGGVAHDFNNMLCVILGFTDIALKSLPKGSDVIEDLKDVKEAAQRSTDLTRQLLAFSRKQTITPVVIKPNICIGNMERMLSRVLGEDITIDMKLGDDLWDIMIDAGQFDQIIANLAVNARDAMPEGGILTIQTHNVVIDDIYCSQQLGVVLGEYVVINVTDTGVGMPQDIIEHIFEPFYTTKEAGKGTGLGLSTVYGVIEQNKGFINVYSEPGHGASFKVHFPRYVGDEEEFIPEGSDSEVTGGEETVLVVEDEAQLRRLASNILSSAGYNVLDAESGEDAMEKFVKHRDKIDLVLTDVVMPGMNGVELAENILKESEEVKILFMSGYAGGILPIKTILEQGAHLLQKPFSYSILLKAVRQTLDEIAGNRK